MAYPRPVISKLFYMENMYAHRRSFSGALLSKKIRFLLAILLLVMSQAKAQYSSVSLYSPYGSPCVGSTQVFVLQGSTSCTPSWYVSSHGTIVSQSSTSIQVRWNSAGSATVSAYLCGTPVSTYLTISNMVTPSVSIIKDKTSICGNGIDQVKFTASPTNGGSSPTYQWYKNGTAISGATTSTFTTNSKTIISSSDAITCVVFSSASCVTTYASKPSNAQSVTVNTPSPINVTIQQTTQICADGKGSFIAYPAGGGSYTYTWRVNEQTRASDPGPPVYGFTTTLNTNDRVSCVITATGSCNSNNPATSNSITVTRGEAKSAGVFISFLEGTMASSNGYATCYNNRIVFKANPANGGTSPSFEWFVNGTSVGNNANTYAIQNFTGQTVAVTLRSNEICVSNSTVSANAPPIAIYHKPNVTLALLQVCKNGPPLTLTTGSPAGGTYSGPGVIDGKFYPGNVAVGNHTITYSYTNSNGCSNTATNIITVNPVPATPTINGPASFCQGSSAVLTASAGTSYVWNTGATTQSITVSTVGSYTVQVTDGYCTSAVSAPFTVSYFPNQEVSITSQVGLGADIGTTLTANSGKTGNAVIFDGVDDKITFNQSYSLIQNNFTVEAWVNPTGIHEIDLESNSSTDGVANQRYLMFPTHGGDSGTNSNMGISVGTNGVSVYEHAGGYMPALLVWPGTINGWTHIAVVYQNRQPSLFINGTLVKTGLISNKMTIHPSANIGGEGYGYYKGSIDEVRVWNTVRTAAELQSSRDAMLPDNISGLVGYYPMDELNGVTTADASGRANHGTLTNGANRLASSYTWSPAIGLNSTNGATVKASPGVNTTYTVTATNSNGCTSQATITVGPNNYNYVVSNTILVEGKTTEAQLENLTVNQRSQSISYLDGLGREMQTVITQGSPSKKDIVQPISYDAFGRPDKTYLPYVGGTSGFFITDALHPTTYTSSAQYRFYQQNTGKIAIDTAPYSQTIFEVSPLNRVEKQGAAGLAWQPDDLDYTVSTDRSVKTVYRSNTATEVRLWQYNTRTNSFSAPGFYAAQELQVTETRDEHQARILEFKDKEGRVVLKKVQTSEAAPASENDYLQTYYVYDDLGNLRLVVPPLAVKELASSAESNWTPSAALAENLCFQYEYDSRQRLIKKQVPGAKPVYMIYNQRDQLIMSQDGEQGKLNKWSFTKYDAFGRAIITGILTDSRTPIQMQSSASSHLIQFESRSSTGINGYTLTDAFPINVSEADLLSLTFYDDYNYPGFQDTKYAFVSPGTTGGWTAENFTYVKGQVTGSKTKVLSSNTWLTSVNYYDDNYRILQTVSDNNLAGTDRLSNRYDFTGKVLESLATHSKGTEQHTVRNNFTYDHGGRLLQSTQRMDADDPVVLASNEYNELGQLVDKKLHRPLNRTSHLQSVDYRYNIRGWMTHINNTALNSDNGQTNDEVNDVFGFELTYNNPTSASGVKAQYNGNIAESFWKTSTDKQLRGYQYGYDRLNRLNRAGYYQPTAVPNEDYSVSNISYDANGNILSMHRQGLQSELNGVKIFGELDKLTYKYNYTTSGNKLLGVDDKKATGVPLTTASKHDFEDLNGRSFTTNDEYEYDLNGNLIRDDNKGITGIIYNHLNLPEQINFGPDKYIKFAYNAAGVKLGKRVVEPNKSDKYTDYSGSFVYQNDTLEFAHTAEGRALYNLGTDKWKYEYHLKDHLGNLRVSFAEPETEVYLATMEPARAQQEYMFSGFSNSASNSKITVSPHYENTHKTTTLGGSGQYAVRLNRFQTGQALKPGISLKVVLGDVINAKVRAKYLDLRKSQLNASVLLSALTGAAGYSITSDAAATYIIDQATGGVATLSNGGGDATNQPKGYLNYYLFDDNDHLVASGYKQIGSAAAVTSAATLNGDHQVLMLNEIPITRSGYIRIELSHDAPENVEIYFDDLEVSHQRALVVQENHYDPWGQNLVGIESKGKPEHKFQYNGKEKQEDVGLNWNDYGARFYDPQLGRWHTIDPLADEMRRHSPYNYGFDNPIRFIDPDGMRPVDDIYINTRAQQLTTIKTNDDFDRVIVNGENSVITEKGYIKALWDEHNLPSNEVSIGYGSSVNKSTISDYSTSVVVDIMNETGNTSIQINSAGRTVEDQVRVMSEMVESQGMTAQKKLYGSNGDKVLDLHPDQSAMVQKANELGPGKISKHTVDPSKMNVVDVSPHRNGIKNPVSFATTAEKHSGVSRVLSPYNSNDPAIHIEIPQPQKK